MQLGPGTASLACARLIVSFAFFTVIGLPQRTGLTYRLS